MRDAGGKVWGAAFGRVVHSAGGLSSGGEEITVAGKAHTEETEYLESETYSWLAALWWVHAEGRGVPLESGGVEVLSENITGEIIADW